MGCSARAMNSRTRAANSLGGDALEEPQQGERDPGQPQLAHRGLVLVEERRELRYGGHLGLVGPAAKRRRRRSRAGRSRDARTTACRRCRGTPPGRAGSTSGAASRNASTASRVGPGRHEGRRVVSCCTGMVTPQAWTSTGIVGSGDAPEAHVAHSGVDRLRAPGGRAVAQAVGVGAEVGAALDDLATRPGTAAGRRRDSLPGHRLAGSPARSTDSRRRRDDGWSTSRRSTPTRCRPCRRGRTRWPGRNPTGDVRVHPLSLVLRQGKSGPSHVLAMMRPPGRASSPQVKAAPSRPPRAAYSHSASVGSAAPAQAA